jgi:rhodanese-related sulfurtransferase
LPYGDAVSYVLILLYCKAGLRSYIAYRILVRKGFKAKSISDGCTLYDMIEEWQDLPAKRR